MFISYAQNFEDVMLWRALKNVEKGFYIDIGAQDPVIDSVSLAFYEHGWRGVHVEPVPCYAEKLRRARPDETVIQAAVGAGSGVLNFFEIIDTGLSTGDAQVAERHREAGFTVRETVVPCLPLCDILDRYQDRDIHWLKIDVEGMEAEVLQGWQPSGVRPWILVVESTLPLTQKESFAEWELKLLELGYDFVYFDGLNRFYLSQNHQELKVYFRYPPNVFDNFTLSGTTSGAFCSLLNDKLARREHELNAQLESSREEIRRLEQALAEREREAGELQVRLVRAGEEMQQLTQTFARREQELVARLEHSREEALEKAKSNIQQYENELNSARMKIDELNGQAHRLWTVADSLNRELQGVYASWSWRLTRPLRQVNLYRKKLPCIVKAVLVYTSRLLRRVARRFLEAGLAHVRRHPGHKARLKALLARWPRLQARLYAFAAARHVSSTGAALSPQAAPAASLDLSGYPVSVRTAYLQLTAARAQVDQSREKEGRP